MDGETETRRRRWLWSKTQLAGGRAGPGPVEGTLRPEPFPGRIAPPLGHQIIISGSQGYCGFVHRTDAFRTVRRTAASGDHTSTHASLPHHGRVQKGRTRCYQQDSLQCSCPWLRRLGQWVWPRLLHSAH